MKEQMLNVVIVKPDREPEVCMINNNIETVKQIVGKSIEFMDNYDNDGTVIVLNRNGKKEGNPFNRTIFHNNKVYDIIYGNFIVLDTNIDGEFSSLSNEKIKKYYRKLSINRNTDFNYLWQLVYDFDNIRYCVSKEKPDDTFNHDGIIYKKDIDSLHITVTEYVSHAHLFKAMRDLNNEGAKKIKNFDLKSILDNYTK